MNSVCYSPNTNILPFFFYTLLCFFFHRWLNRSLESNTWYICECKTSFCFHSQKCSLMSFRKSTEANQSWGLLMLQLSPISNLIPRCLAPAALSFTQSLSRTTGANSWIFPCIVSAPLHHRVTASSALAHNRRGLCLWSSASVACLDSKQCELRGRDKPTDRCQSKHSTETRTQNKQLTQQLAATYTAGRSTLPCLK